MSTPRLRHILMVTEDFPPLPGGVAKFLFHIASHACARVTVLAPQVLGWEEADEGRPFTIRRIRMRRRFALLKFLKEIWRMRGRQGEVALFFGHVSAIFIAAAILLRRRPMVVLIHGNDLYTFLLRGRVWRWAVRAALRRCDLVMGNSAFNRDRLPELGVPAAKAAILNPGVDLDLFAPGDRAATLVADHGLAGRRILLTVGRLVRRKNHRAVLEALAVLKKDFPELAYVIVGEGPERGRIEAHAAHLEIGESVLFRGTVPDQELAGWYNACDIFVLPSLWIPEKGDVEGFGMVFAEAGACAKPVIAANTGGIPDAVQDGVTALLSRPGDPGALSGAIRRLLVDPNEARRMGEAGRAYVERELTWQQVAQRFDSLVENLFG